MIIKYDLHFLKGSSIHYTTYILNDWNKTVTEKNPIQRSFYSLYEYILLAYK